jgi:hypothetical protein
MKYYLSIYNRETDDLIYENAFSSYAELEDELENWDLEDCYYQIETMETL